MDFTILQKNTIKVIKLNVEMFFNYDIQNKQLNLF